MLLVDARFSNPVLLVFVDIMSQRMEAIRWKKKHRVANCLAAIGQHALLTPRASMSDVEIGKVANRAVAQEHYLYFFNIWKVKHHGRVRNRARVRWHLALLLLLNEPLRQQRRNRGFLWKKENDRQQLKEAMVIDVEQAAQLKAKATRSSRKLVNKLSAARSSLKRPSSWKRSASPSSPNKAAGEVGDDNGGGKSWMDTE